MRLATREDPTRKETRYLFRCEGFRTREHTLGSLISMCYHWPYDLRWSFLLPRGNVKVRYTAPTRKDCMASAIWLAVSTSWPSHYNSKRDLDRCHLPRNLIVALSPWESIPFHSECTIDFPLFSLQRNPEKKKLYNDSIQADIKLLIWTNITHTHKKSKLSPNYSLDPPHPFVKNNRDPSAADKTRPRIYQSCSTHHATSNFFSAGLATFSDAMTNSTLATHTWKLNSSCNALLSNETFITDKEGVCGGFLSFLPSYSSIQILTLIF